MFHTDLAYWYLDAIQVVLTLIVIYMLYIFSSFQNKVAKRDDPFSNSNILGFLMFCIVVQKYIVDYVFADVLASPDMRETTIVVIRQTFVAIELLFIIIPIRHNFSLEHVET